MIGEHFYTGTIKTLDEIESQCDGITREKGKGLISRCCKRFRLRGGGRYHQHRICIWLERSDGRFKKIVEIEWSPRYEAELPDIFEIFAKSLRSLIKRAR